ARMRPASDVGCAGPPSGYSLQGSAGGSVYYEGTAITGRSGRGGRSVPAEMPPFRLRPPLGRVPLPALHRTRPAHEAEDPLPLRTGPLQDLGRDHAREIGFRPHPAPAPGSDQGV